MRQRSALRWPLFLVIIPLVVVLVVLVTTVVKIPEGVVVGFQINLKIAPRGPGGGGPNFIFFPEEE